LTLFLFEKRPFDILTLRYQTIVVNIRVVPHPLSSFKIDNYST
jgi:hypothetical protein